MEKQILEVLNKSKTENKNGNDCIIEQDFEELAKKLNDLFALRSVMRSNVIDYKTGFELAMKYINESPCDPDIYKEQLEAWEKLQDFIKENKE